MAQSDEQTNMRMPVDLKAWLKEEAQKSRRSFASEVVHRLDESRLRQVKKEAKASTAGSSGRGA
ncbi:Arc family DNA-binding protein [Acidovorax sp. LjRoot66]|uniref:Arc family DNA-binding protein n=1 Tax=Acidovorax sp. LjRoot66 TaxID=3342334 RepID=UPI003ED0E4C5